MTKRITIVGWQCLSVSLKKRSVCSVKVRCRQFLFNAVFLSPQVTKIHVNIFTTCVFLPNYKKKKRTLVDREKKSHFFSSALYERRPRSDIYRSKTYVILSYINAI